MNFGGFLKPPKNTCLFFLGGIYMEEKRMIPFILIKNGKTHTSEIDVNEFLEKIQKIGREQSDHMAKTIEGIVPRIKRMYVNYNRNLDRDVPDLYYWEEGEKTSRAISIHRHHSDIWKIINHYCDEAEK